MLKLKFEKYKIGMVAAAFFLYSCGGSSGNEASNGSSEVDEPASADNDGFVEIFDGETLDGWEGDPNHWRVEEGNIIGEVTPAVPLESNTFLIWQGGELADFELKGEFNITEAGNSGINYRSEQLPDIPFALRGYQADIDGRNSYTGQNYEERKRTTLAYPGQKTVVNGRSGELRENVERNAWLGLEVTETLGEPDELRALINKEDWNSFHLVIKGNRLQHYINGTLMSDVTDEDTVNRTMTGLLGIQVHTGPPMQVRYRNLLLKKL